jgi:phosphate:Na+ symporter
MQNHQVSETVSGSMVAGGLVGVAAMGYLASVGGTYISRRIALIFLLITTCVTLLFVIISPLLADTILPGLASAGNSNGTYLIHQLSWVYTSASLCAALFAVALSGPVSRLLASSEGSNGNGADSAQSCAGYLDVRIINTPTIAIEQARKEIVRMMSVTSFMYADVRELVFEFDARRAETIRQHEKILDSLNHEITSFLALLSRSTKNPEINYEIPVLLQTVSALEHIGDRCESVLNIIVTRKNAGVIFSEAAMDDLKTMLSAVGSVMNATQDAVRSGLPIEEDALHLIKRTTRTCFDRVKQDHFDRISSGACAPQAMMLFNDMASAFYSISELCWNILGMQVRRLNE